MTIRRFHVFSVGKMLGAIYATVSLFIIIPALMFAIVVPMVGGAALAEDPDFQEFAGAFGMLGAVGGVVLALMVPFIYGALGFVAGCIMALLYNLFARFTGGIRFDPDEEDAAVVPAYGTAPPPAQY